MTLSISDDILEQTEQCFINIKNTLKEANASFNDIVRITYTLPNTNDFENVDPF